MTARTRKKTVLRRIGRAAVALTAATSMVAAAGAPAAAYTPRFSFAGIGDWDGDDHQDLLARDTRGRLWLFPGDSSRGPSSERRVLIGHGFADFWLAAVVDWDGDGNVDLIVRDGRGRLLLHVGESTRGYSGEGWTLLGGRFAGYSFAGAADWDGDEHADLIARDGRGQMWLFPGASERGPGSERPVLIGRGFTGFTFAGVADWDADGHVDLVARDGRGRMWLYPGESERGYSSERRVLIGHGLAGYSLPDIADWDGDENVDLVVRDTGGLLWLYPGESTRGYSSERRVLLGRGW